jgi:hypothetical protein
MMNTSASSVDKYISWSLLDPRPCLYHIGPDVVVFWNGSIMPYNMALALTADIIFQTAISYGISDQIAEDYEKILIAGVISGTEPWWVAISSLDNRSKYVHVKMNMNKHISQLGTGLKNKKQALLWFNKENSITNQRNSFNTEKSEAQC